LEILEYAMEVHHSCQPIEASGFRGGYESMKARRGAGLKLLRHLIR